MSGEVVLFSGILAPFTGIPTTCAFLLGAVTSIVAGWVGMEIATFTNARVTHQCWLNLTVGYDVAIRGGSVISFTLVSIGVLNFYALIFVFNNYLHFDSDKELYEAIVGYGLGGSSIALFDRVGGGIYTKAADVGADLCGKNE